MKIELDEVQIFFIEKKLAAAGLKYEPLQNELLDHLCCVVEENMQLGQTFETAVHAIFETFGKDELQELQQQTIFLTHQKSRFMKNVAFACLGFLIISSSFIFYKKSKTTLTQGKHLTIQPPSPEEMMSISDLEKTELEESKRESFTKEKNFAKRILTTLHDPPSIKPLEGNPKINSHFGMRFHPVEKKKKMHTGMDFKAPKGTPVLATADGVVHKTVRDKERHGKHIVIGHDDIFQTMYSHLDKILVEEGQKINKGEVIGLVGSTGWSSGPHLHYEVIKNGKQVDPIEYFNP